MPLTPGSSEKVMDENFHEFRHGKTYAHTRAKYGKARANAQLAAVVLGNARKYRGASTYKKKA